MISRCSIDFQQLTVFGLRKGNNDNRHVIRFKAKIKLNTSLLPETLSTFQLALDLHS
jgi:hypothetical protein